uniref:Uncharacterized protein n=1 Tax=Romanomermis culicivorax TaxID=13658 RepID=A0A915L1U7_ROMCU
MPGQFENAENPDQPNDPQNSQRRGLLTGRRFAKKRGRQSDDVRYDGYKIDKIENVAKEGEFLRANAKTDGQFGAEPQYTNCFDYEKPRFGRIETFEESGHSRKWDVRGIGIQPTEHTLL